jgi:glycogen(starch) synthase
MKILVLTDFYPPHYIGGYELQCCDQVTELARRGHEVVVLTSRWQVGAGESDGPVHRLLAVVDPYGGKADSGAKLYDPLRLRRRQRQVQMAMATRRNRIITREVIAECVPDVVFVWNLNSVGVGPALAAQEFEFPVVFNLYDYWLADLKAGLDAAQNPLKRWYHAAINALSDFTKLGAEHVLVSSRAMKQAHIELGFAAESIRVIPLGLPAQLIVEPDNLPAQRMPGERSLKLLFVGRLVPEKGLEVALAALAYTVQELGHDGASLDIIGNGSEEYINRLREIITSLNLREQVRLVGPLQRRQVLARYATYDSLLVPSLWVEPFGMTVVEAMARGLPVIAANHGGPAEIIADGQDGRLVPPGDPVALAHALVELVSDPGLVHRMRIRALQTVRERYTLECVVDQVESSLQAVLGWAG